jgi:hypothetical protein
MQARVDTVIAEITDWLAKNPSINEQVGAIADIVGEQTVAILSQYGHVISR